ncbi:hypothetical protein [Planctomonas deserti]|uniref:hypothetical protein n=1 Tax=Planctomonas deserti TaxID=2144185 RepID=UPI000D36E41B|nr:hypothetical protein [Planctomonas deserti]
MRLSRRWTEKAAGEDGSASIEFVVAGLLMLVPLVYLVLALSAVQAAAFATEGSARQAARAYVRSETPADAVAAVDRAVRIGLADYGLEASSAEVVVTCSPEPARCLTRRGTVAVTVRVSVPLPLLPAAVQASTPLAVPVEGRAVQAVSRFWAGEE